MSEYKARTKPRIKIRLHDDKHIDDYRWFTELSLRYFVTFATGLSNYPFNINAVTSDSSIETDIYQRLEGYAERSEPVSDENILFTLADIEDCVSDCLSNWFEIASRIYAAIYLYVETVDNDSLRPDLKFLLLAQALESYHSNSNHNDKYLSSAEFRHIAKNG